MYIKAHKSYRLVVAICDTDLIGKSFEEGKRVLSISESFYKGDLIENEEELSEKIKDYSREDATFNIVGKKSIRIALKLGIISEEGIKKVEGVPFALVLL